MGIKAAQTALAVALSTLPLPGEKVKTPFQLEGNDPEFLRRYRLFQAGGGNFGNTGENRKDKFIDGTRYSPTRKKKLGVPYRHPKIKKAKAKDVTLAKLYENGLYQPKCATCGAPATCKGAYEGHKQETFGCDTCCGHGNEDGHCVPV